MRYFLRAISRAEQSINKATAFNLPHRFYSQPSILALLKPRPHQGYGWVGSRQSFCFSTQASTKIAQEIENRKSKIKEVASKIEETTGKVQEDIVKTQKFLDNFAKRFKEIVAALVCLITGINEFLHSTMNTELKKLRDSIKKEQQDSKGKKVYERIQKIMKKQKVDPQIAEINFNFRQTMFNLLAQSSEHNILLLESPKDNCLSTFCKSFIQKYDQENKAQSQGQKVVKSQLNKYDEYRYVDMKSLVFVAQNGNDVVEEFVLYLKNTEKLMIQNKKRLLLVIDSIESVDQLTCKNGQPQKVNVSRLAKVLHQIQKSHVFSIALISYDPYFFQNYFFGNNHFKNYNLDFDTIDSLNSEDVKKLITKKISLNFPKFTEFISQKHNSETQVLQILDFCKIFKEQSKLLLKNAQLQDLLKKNSKQQTIDLLKQEIKIEEQLVLKKAQKISNQILKQSQKIIERSLNKMYINLNNEQEYSKKIKIIDSKLILLREAVTNGAINKTFIQKFAEQQQKMLYSAMKELNQEEILFKNTFSSYSMKKGVQSCLQEYKSK